MVSVWREVTSQDHWVCRNGYSTNVLYTVRNALRPTVLRHPDCHYAVKAEVYHD